MSVGRHVQEKLKIFIDVASEPTLKDISESDLSTWNDFYSTKFTDIFPNSMTRIVRTKWSAFPLDKYEHLVWQSQIDSFIQNFFLQAVREMNSHLDHHLTLPR